MLNDQTPWHLGTATCALATNAQIQSVLGSVTSVQIRAEYSLNIDTNDLDNEILSVSVVPEPSPAALLLGGVALLAVWRNRRDARLAEFGSETLAG